MHGEVILAGRINSYERIAEKVCISKATNGRSIIRSEADGELFGVAGVA
jgi:hypothetical protein